MRGDDHGSYVWSSIRCPRGASLDSWMLAVRAARGGSAAALAEDPKCAVQCSKQQSVPKHMADWPFFRGAWAGILQMLLGSHAYHACLACMLASQVSFGFPHTGVNLCPSPNPATVLTDLSAPELRTWLAQVSSAQAAASSTGSGVQANAASDCLLPSDNAPAPPLLAAEHLPRPAWHQSGTLAVTQISSAADAVVGAKGVRQDGGRHS
jgi:hypothetical protein